MSKLMIAYSRISRDEDGNNYETIENQNDLITNYYRKVLNYQGKILYKEDDNKSGYNFNRDGFKEIRNLVLQNKVETIVFKDLSRFGRNNALTLVYYDEFVLDREVRLIGVSDNHDSNIKSCRDTLGIFTWSNERYIKDVSDKIYSVFKRRQEKGDLLITLPYGYLKEDNKIIIDEYASQIVKEIFDLYIDGNGYRNIANIMNEKKILTPSLYKNRKDASKIWNSQIVHNILFNEFYIGILLQRKTYKKRIKGKSYKTPDDQVLKFENHHEAIISKEKFELVQKICLDRNNNNTRGRKGKGNIHLFSSKIFCGKCKKTYVFLGKKDSYVCGTKFKYGSKYCNNIYIYENKLLTNIQRQIKLQLENNQKILESLKSKMGQKKELKNIDFIINKLQNQIEKLEKNIQKIYIDKLNNDKGIPEYILDNTLKQLSNELEIYKKQLEENLLIKNSVDKQQKILENENEKLQKFINRDYTRTDIEILIDKIVVNENGGLSISWNFSNSMS